MINSSILCHLRSAAIAAAFVSLLAGAVSARELTSSERDGLKAQVGQFNDAMTKLDFDVIGATIPPKVLSHIAKTAGVPEDQLKLAIGAQMKQALAAVKIVDFSMDLEKAEYRETPDGTPYALLPTVTRMDANGTKMEASSSTLALMDEGKWYLLRIDSANQLSMLRAVYPAFAAVEVPPGSMRALD